MLVYMALMRGRSAALPAVPEYARYIKWLVAQDREEAMRLLAIVSGGAGYTDPIAVR